MTDDLPSVSNFLTKSVINLGPLSERVRPVLRGFRVIPGVGFGGGVSAPFLLFSSLSAQTQGYTGGRFTR